MPNRFRSISWKKLMKWLLLALIAIIILVVLISFQTTNVEAIPLQRDLLSCSYYNLRADCFLEFYDSSHGARFDVTEKGITRNEFIWYYDSDFGVVSINNFEEEEWQLFTIKEGLFDDSTRIIYERYEGLISTEIQKQGKKCGTNNAKNELLVTQQEEKQYAKTIIQI